VTTVVVEPSICSEQITIVVGKTNKHKVQTTFGSRYETVIKLSEPLTEVNQCDTVRQHSAFQVLQTVSRFQVHIAYSVAAAIRKVVKVEDNYIMPTDVIPPLEFVKLQLSPIGMHPEESR